MSATTAPIVPQPGTQQPPSLRESLQQLNNFLRSFPPDQLRETVWNMLYESLSSEGFDGRPSDDRSHILFFYSEITQLISHLVNIDRHMGDFAEGLWCERTEGAQSSWWFRTLSFLSRRKYIIKGEGWDAPSKWHRGAEGSSPTTSSRANLPKAYEARELREHNHHDGSGRSVFSVAGSIL